MVEEGVIQGLLARRVPRASDAGHFALDSLPTGWFALSHRWVESTPPRRHARGRWHSIRNVESGACVFRTLRFDPTLRFEALSDEGIAAGEIWIDYDGWLELSGRAADVPEKMRLRVRRARWWEIARLAEKHPDPTYRLALHIAWLSILLSGISILIALLGRR